MKVIEIKKFPHKIHSLDFFEFACCLGDEKIVAALIKNGTDIEEKTKAGMTALLLAAFYGNFQQKKNELSDLKNISRCCIIISNIFCDDVYYFDF